MNPRSLVACVLLIAALPLTLFHARADELGRNASASVIDSVDRKIVKEPKYASSPRYALLILGTAGESKVWMVEDGKTLYIDKNGNGDLTDDGPPIAQSNVSARDCDYVLDEIEPLDGSRHTTFRLARWNYGDKDDSYGLVLSLGGTTPMYCGWFGPFWGPSSETTQIFHFGGPLTPVKLRGKNFVVGGGTVRLSVAFFNEGRRKGSATRLSIDALPANVVPEVHIDWPVAEGASALATSHKLDQRCCYWEFYNPNFQVPPGAAPGTATAIISFSEGTFPFELTTDRIEIPVVTQATSAAGE
jgi:hypothetical protein